MDSLKLLKTFREVAHRNSFSDAARALDLAPATVSKYIFALEARYDARLFNRTTRSISLTDAGRLLLERSEPVLDRMDLTQDEMLDRATRPSGQLNLTAPHILMHTMLVRLLGEFMERYPEVKLNLRLTNRAVGLAEDGVDAVLRVGRIRDSSLIVRRLVPLEIVVAATRPYWQTHGYPTHPRELLAHPTLAIAPPGGKPHWRFNIDGKLLDLSLQPIFMATDWAPLVPLALRGLGVIRGSRVLLSDPVALGALEPLFGEYSQRGIWLYAAYAQRNHNSAALRALLAFLEAQYRQWRERNAVGDGGLVQPSSNAIAREVEN